MLKYIKEESVSGPRLPLIMCPGCGSGQILNYVLNAIDTLVQEKNWSQDDFSIITGVGCSARLTSHYLRFDSGWTIHGRAMAIATGVQLANPKLKTIVLTGDGDCAAIGGNHFIHACRRNLDMTIICINNSLFGMTGGQMSPTTSIGHITSSTPFGNPEENFDLCQLAKSAGATYVARWTTAHPRQAIKAIIKGIEKKGASFIDILSQCPVHYKKTPVEMFRDMKKHTIPLKKADNFNIKGKLPVGELHSVDKADWIERYHNNMIDNEQGNRRQ
jgi:2-oxoglutarate ferredoxin oxidoreductase subunit beta